MRISSTKILAKVGIASPGMTSPSPASTQNETAMRMPRARPWRALTTLGRFPPGLNSGLGSKVSTTPEKLLSNSSWVTVRRPYAGSLRYTRSRPIDSRTRKWLNSQKTMQGSLI
jgi:hypothetical protein